MNVIKLVLTDVLKAIEITNGIKWILENVLDY